MTKFDRIGLLIFPFWAAAGFAVIIWAFGNVVRDMFPVDAEAMQPLGKFHIDETTEDLALQLNGYHLEPTDDPDEWLVVKDTPTPTMTPTPDSNVVKFNGKCPFCQREGRKSTVTCLGGSTTLAAAHSYFDEDGNYHYDDPNTTTMNYRCSNGHEFSTHSGGGREREEVVIYDASEMTTSTLQTSGITVISSDTVDSLIYVDSLTGGD